MFVIRSTQCPSTPGLAAWLMNSTLVPRVYERWWRPALGFLATAGQHTSMSQEYAAAADALHLGPGATVVDLACGTGAFTRAFAERVGPDGRAIGIDASTVMLERARADTPAGVPVSYVQADAHDLPVPDGSVDAICCYAALHLMDDPEAVIESATRALRTGGRIAIFTSARHGSRPWRDLDDAIGSIGGLRMFERDEVRQLLARHGFTDIDRRIEGVTQTVTATCSAPVRLGGPHS
jgi:ubiquinone/menaquinone biosynthesis C-methylase UbiE